MDDAFSALDLLIRHDMQTRLKEIQARLHKTFVFITDELADPSVAGSGAIGAGAPLQASYPARAATQGAVRFVPADDSIAGGLTMKTVISSLAQP